MKTDNVDANIIALIDKLTDIKRAMLWDTAEKYGLTPLQIQIVQYIYQCAAHSPVLAKDVAKELLISKATLSVALNALLKKGLVQRHHDTNDKRKSHLTLTKKGTELANNLSTTKDTLVTYITLLNKKDKRIVFKVLSHFVLALQTNGIIDYIRMCVRCEHCKNVSKNVYQCLLTGRTFEFEDIHIGCCNFVQQKAM